MAEIPLPITVLQAAGADPALLDHAISLRFDLGQFDSRLTFSRSCPAFYVGQDGVMHQAAANTPRFDYDPITLSPRGLLVEEQRTNLLLSSQAFDSSNWVRSNVSVVANAAIAPDGTMTADKVVGAAGASARYIGSSIATGTNITYAGSVYAKDAGLGFFQLNFSNFANDSRGVKFDLQSGTVRSVDANGPDFTAIGGSITAVGGGWYRCTIVATKGSANAYTRLTIDPKDASLNASGDGVSGFYVWQGQIEAGLFATSPIVTDASTATRLGDVVTMGPSSFLPLASGGAWTIYAEMTPDGLPYYPCGLFGAYSSASPGTDFLIVRAGNSISGADCYSFLGGVPVIDSSSVSIPPGQTAKLALAVQAGSIGLSKAGAVTTAAPASIPTNLDTLAVGLGNPSGFKSMSGHLKKLAYFRGRLSNSQLQVMTA